MVLELCPLTFFLYYLYVLLVLCNIYNYQNNVSVLKTYITEDVKKKVKLTECQ